jgi:hypothetical protein
MVFGRQRQGKVVKDPRIKKTNRKAIYLAVGNAAIALIVLLSPVGVGEGSGVIGYSVVRLLVFVFLQAPIAIAGIVKSYRGRRRGNNWRLGLIANVIVVFGTLMLYFYQSRTLGWLTDN